MHKINASPRDGMHAEESSSLCENTHATGVPAGDDRSAPRSSKFAIPSVMERLSINRRRTKQPAAVAASASPAPRSLAGLPPEVLRKIGDDLHGSRDVINLALTASSLQTALAPESTADKVAFLKETAASAHDPESFALELRTARTLPPPIQASLLKVHASRLREIATGDGSFLEMMAGAKDAAERFRLLAAQTASLPAEFRGGPSAALAPHLKYLPADERRGKMEMMLEATRDHASPHERREIIGHFAVGMNQFDYQVLPELALRLLREAETLPAEQRRELVDDFRTGLSCKMLADDKAAIEAALARFDTM